MRILSIFVLFSVCYTFLHSSFDSEPEYIKMSDSIISKTSKELIKRYPEMSLIGTGGAFIDCIHKLSLSFSYTGNLRKEDVRKLLVDCALQLLNNINSDSKIRPFLETAPEPFTIKNVEIIIFFSDKSGKTAYDPYIAVASCFKGSLLFDSEEPGQKIGYKNSYKESFEEALKILQDERS